MPRGRETAAEAVIQTVAETTDTDPLELPPLYETIDPDALDALIEDMQAGSISFTYTGREITVHSDGTVTIDEPSTGKPAPEAAKSDD